MRICEYYRYATKSGTSVYKITGRNIVYSEYNLAMGLTRTRRVQVITVSGGDVTVTPRKMHVRNKYHGAQSPFVLCVAKFNVPSRT